ncbi:MAG TPA: phage tail protein [Allosphingosinicella sp.]|jgi:phage tail-like protein|nr:phage tail protein [Allosphingosinicella sp.]
MSETSTDRGRVDPYRNYRFRIVWDGKVVAGVSKVSGLKRSTDVVQLRELGDPTLRLAPGQQRYEAITLERGISHDSDFENWANLVWTWSPAAAGAPDFRKDIRIELYDEAGQLALAYDVHRCWPSEFTAVGELDGTGNAFAIQSLVLQNEGWERDASIAGPKPAETASDPDP